MKSVIALSTLGVIALASAAQADLIAGWNFNNIPAIATAGTPAALGITSISASSGTGTVSLTGWTGNIDDFGGTTVNQIGADVAGASLSLIGAGPTAGPFPGNGGSITFTANLTGFENPIVSYATQRTATGFNSDQFAYSTDGGANFTDFGSAYNPATAYAVQSFDLSSVNALDGVPVVFRITFSGATSNSGNNRIDNLQVNASAVPTPGAVAMIGLGGLALTRRRR